MFQDIDCSCDIIEFSQSETETIPEIDLIFTACRSSGNKYCFDIVDFNKKKLFRWFVSLPNAGNSINNIKNIMYKNELPLGYDNYEKYYEDQYIVPHTAQLSPDGKMFIGFGAAESGFSVLVVDTNNASAKFFSSNSYGDFLYSSTGDFDENYSNWYYANWPIENKKRQKSNEYSNLFNIFSINIDTLKTKNIISIGKNSNSESDLDVILPRRVHQLTMSKDGRYIVCTPFDFDPVIPYPNCPIEDDLEGYRKTHEGGMRLEHLITIDLFKKNHWFTEIPTPVPAHIEFDLYNDDIFYVSAHNIAAHNIGTILEGPAVIYKVKITKYGSTIIDSHYTNKDFFRITQHSVFLYNSKVYIAVTCVPNKLIIIDSSDMSLWRSIDLFNSAPLKLKNTGALSPENKMTVYSLNPSTDGKYIVMENADSFIVYDVNSDKILPSAVPRSLPKGFVGRGHTRTIGQ